ncbi:PREDICTED: agamous-like MADS-box protein AGL3 [Priapulus caudatus]|uniref:Agamous-like MADS-box protein AGL3 n=1 Tax=Priapulus caudatus TaxID=37621 RepID=A0ABM1ESX4_PRICU|nr:PREDICTED: agamous-like MADS-box protein AGL3 [Priapulus caudatus]
MSRKLTPTPAGSPSKRSTKLTPTPAGSPSKMSRKLTPTPAGSPSKRSDDKVTQRMADVSRKRSIRSGPVLVEKIEKKTNEKVVFSRRRQGLMKKMYELVTMCNCNALLLIERQQRHKVTRFYGGTETLIKTYEGEGLKREIGQQHLLVDHYADTVIAKSPSKIPEFAKRAVLEKPTPESVEKAKQPIVIASSAPASSTHKKKIVKRQLVKKTPLSTTLTNKPRRRKIEWPKNDESSDVTDRSSVSDSESQAKMSKEKTGTKTKLNETSDLVDVDVNACAKCLKKYSKRGAWYQCKKCPRWQCAACSKNRRSICRYCK